MRDTRYPCCGGLAQSRLDRRRFLQLSAGAGIAAGFPFPAAAGEFEALLLICSDPRVWKPTAAYLKSRELEGRYRPFAIEGGAIGLVAEHYRNLPLRKEFWDNLAASVTWSNVRKIIALNHRDCGAAHIAYGLSKTADQLIETEMHRYALNEFRNQVALRHADLDVEIGLMALDGKVQTLK